MLSFKYKLFLLFELFYKILIKSFKKNMKTYLIDGNNLMPKINQIKNQDKQSAREKLVFLLENYFSSKKSKLYLHFDGFENSPLGLTNGKIIYSGKSSADKNIKDQIETAKNRKDLIIITSDHEIQNFARVCSCEVISSEAFAKELSKKNNSDEEASKIKSMNNINEFKKLFNIKD